MICADQETGEEEGQEEIYKTHWFRKCSFYNGSNDWSTRSSFRNYHICGASDDYFSSTAKKSRS